MRPACHPALTVANHPPPACIAIPFQTHSGPKLYSLAAVHTPVVLNIIHAILHSHAQRLIVQLTCVMQLGMTEQVILLLPTSI